LLRIVLRVIDEGLQILEGNLRRYHICRTYHISIDETKSLLGGLFKRDLPTFSLKWAITALRPSSGIAAPMDALSIDCAGMNVIRVVLARREINGDPAAWSKAIFPASLRGRTMPIQVIDRLQALFVNEADNIVGLI
jgi:hypothetical protein